MDPATRPELILGTAGHIDHGKTALIRALTGVDTDRLPEEKARGITIELGFAPFDLPDGTRLGVVDVPGHEGLVRTMVAGATGVDLLLFVVAADEGVMPQTREHLAICDLLGVVRGVVALTKIDAAAPDVAALAEEEVRDVLAGTTLADAPVVPVSSLTGEGISELRAALAVAAADAAPRTPRSGPARLHVDRCFAMKGFGAIVTGSLVGSPLSVGDAVEILPPRHLGRVRGLQRHGAVVTRIEAGARCAVNVQGVVVADLSRGQVLTSPGALAPTRVLDARIRWLHGAPEVRKPTAVEFLVGTAERRARVAPIGSDAVRGGESGFARIHLDGDELALLPGDRFIVRGFARTDQGGATLGGGVVLDVAPPPRRRSDPLLRRELEVFDGGDRAAGIRVRIERRGLAGADPVALSRETGLLAKEMNGLIAGLVENGDVAITGAGTALAVDAVGDLERRILEALGAYHAAEPLRPGMPTAALRGALPSNVPPDAAALAIDRLRQRGEITIEDEHARRIEHRPTLDEASQAIADRILRDAAAAGLDPPSERDWADRLGVASERLRDLLAHLEREGHLTRAPGDLWFSRPAVDDLRARVTAHLEEHGQLDTPTYKTLIGTTRRTAVPLMELFDAEHLTARRGPTRTLSRVVRGRS